MKTLIRSIFLIAFLLPFSAFAQTIVTTDQVTVAVSDRVIIINKSNPGATAIVLPSALTFEGDSLDVYDWHDNAGPMTFTPKGSEKINDASNWTVGSSGARLVPVKTRGIVGWVLR